MTGEHGFIFEQLNDNITALTNKVTDNHDETKRELAKINQTIAVTLQKYCELDKKVEKHDGTLYGNGTEGIVTKMAVMKREWAMVSVGVTALINFLIAVFFKHGSK